jgi:CHAT domain-containing protein
MRRTLLSPQGALLVYLVGPEDAHLIVVPGQGSPTHYRLQVAHASAATLAIAAGPLSEDGLDRILRGDGLAASLGRARGLAKTAADEPSHALVDRRLDALFPTLVPAAVWPILRAASEVLVVPDGPLHGLPLEALVVGRAEGRPTYWLDEGPVVRYAPSATTACNLARAARGAEEAGAASALIVADPAFSRSGPASPEPTRARQGLASLPPLPGTAAEAEAIASVLAPAGTDVRVLRRDEARESAVRGALRERRRPYLHFATHGLVEEDQSELRAALALTPPHDSTIGPDDDGLLQLFEIYDLDARCELAVLSACDSHAGRRVRGEGVFALSRAFLAAGARRVVASLWPVDDASTATLMASFYQRIAGAAPGRPPDYARALRDARLDLRTQARWADPYYWAPFVITGAP